MPQDLTNKFKEAGLDGDLAKAAGYAEELYSKVSWAYQAYSIGKDILTGLGFLESPTNPLEEVNRMLREISRKLDDVLLEIEKTKAAVIDASDLETRQRITEFVTKASSAAYNAKAYIAKPTNEQIKVDFDAARILAQNSASELHENEYYWRRIYVEEAQYSDPWSGTTLYPVKEGPSNRFVWDYRLALFAYLNVIGCRSIVYLAANEGYKEEHLSKMQEYVTFLKENIYLKILNSFGSIRPPSIEEMKYVLATLDEANFMSFRKEGATENFHDDYDFIDPADGRRVRKESLPEYSIDYLLKENLIPGGKWHKRQTNHILGIVEKYTGYSSTVSYPSFELQEGVSLLDIGFDTYDTAYNDFFKLWWARWKERVKIKKPEEFQKFYDRFLVKHTLRTWRQGKKLYNELGLPKIKQTIMHLYQMFGMGPLQGLTDYSAWSILEVYSIIPPSLKGKQEAGEPISLRKMANILYPASAISHAVLISLRQILLLDETNPLDELKKVIG